MIMSMNNRNIKIEFDILFSKIKKSKELWWKKMQVKKSGYSES